MNWDSLYIPVPSAVHQRLEKALEEKEKMNAKKVMKPLTAAALALALILLLGGAAYAAVESGILKYLVNGEQNATDELKNSVQPLDVSVTRDDFRVTLTGIVFDGDRLALSFEEENLTPESPAWITLDQVRLEGEWVPENFGEGEGHWMPFIRLDEEGASTNPYESGFFSASLKNQYAGIVHGEATFVVSRPTGPLVVVDPGMWYDYDAAVEDEDFRADLIRHRDMVRASGLKIADIFSLDPLQWYQEGYTVIDKNGDLLMENLQYADYLPEDFGAREMYHNYVEHPTQMEKSAEFTIPFSFDAGAAKAFRKVGSMEDVTLSACTVHLEKCVMTPLSTLIELRLYPRTEQDEAAADLSDRFGYPVLLDENGLPLAFMDMVGEGLYGSFLRDEDGKAYMPLEYAWGGVVNMPKEVRFGFNEDAFPFQAPVSPDPELWREFSEKVIISLQ